MNYKLIKLLDEKEELKLLEMQNRNKKEKRKLSKRVRSIESKIKELVEEEQGTFSFKK